MKRIPVSQPMLGVEESFHVNEALSKGAISGFFGEYISIFEQEFSEYCGCKFGVSVSSGTAALHLALAALSIGPGDEVIVSSLTNMATFFSVLYQGATPVPVDSDPETMNLDPKLLENLITPKTKAILVVHLFGHPVDMDPVLNIAKRHNLYVIEDCAEAHGATYNGRKVGSIGDIGCFSFYANKVITTGEGGMLTLNDPVIAARARNLKGLAFGDTNKFMHQDIGYNYRMTNIQAAVGHAQFGKIEQIIENKRRIANRYTQLLSHRNDLQLPIEKSYARNVYWMYTVILRGQNSENRNIVMQKLAEKGVESRENFLPYNMQEIFIRKGMTRENLCPIANMLGQSGIYLPSGPVISDEEIDYVCETLISILDH